MDTAVYRAASVYIVSYAYCFNYRQGTGATQLFRDRVHKKITRDVDGDGKYTVNEVTRPVDEWNPLQAFFTDSGAERILGGEVVTSSASAWGQSDIVVRGRVAVDGNGGGKTTDPHMRWAHLTGGHVATFSGSAHRVPNRFVGINAGRSNWPTRDNNLWWANAKKFGWQPDFGLDTYLTEALSGR